MKKILILLLFLSNLSSNFSQDFIKILGREKYSEYAYEYILRIKSNQIENKETNNLLSELKDSGIDYSLDSINGLEIRITKNDWNKYDLIDSMIVKRRINKSVKYKFKESKLEQEDTHAIQAINDAKQKANIISRLIHRKIKRVLNIDDVTERYLFLDDVIVNTECEKRIANLLIEFLSEEVPYNKTEFKTFKREGEYAIWVTFELEKIE